MLVLTREVVRPHMSRVTVAPITGTIRGLSTEVPVGPVNGIDKPSVVSCDNIVTMPADTLGRHDLQPEAVARRSDEDDTRRGIGRWWPCDVHAAAAAGTIETGGILFGVVALHRRLAYVPGDVTLWPGSKRADAQDMFLDGRPATVAAVLFDVDGGTHLAVSLDDLADGDFHPHGRFLYFAPDEVEPIEMSP